MHHPSGLGRRAAGSRLLFLLTAAMSLSSCGLRADDCPVGERKGLTLQQVALANAPEWLPSDIDRSKYSEQIPILLKKDCCKLSKLPPLPWYEILFTSQNFVAIYEFRSGVELKKITKSRDGSPRRSIISTVARVNSCGQFFDILNSTDYIRSERHG
jgi:hypothetical protein